MDHMPALFAGLLMFAAVFGILGGAVLLLSSAQGRVSTRVQRFVGTAETASPSAAGPQKRRHSDLFEQLDERWSEQRSGRALEDEIERADLQLTVSEFTLLRAGAAVLLTLFLIALGPSLWWALLVPGLLIGWWLPRRYLRWAAGRRLRRLDDQLPDILNILAGSVRTGSSLFQALDRIAREAAEPSRTEYLRVVRAISLGAPLEVALGNLAERMPTEDIDMLITSITIQQQTGGNLGQILDLIATTVRERHRIEREIRSLSAQQRLSAYMLGALPILMIGLLYLISPRYMGRLFEPGLILILPCAVVVLLVTGFIVMNRIASIDV